ncbi:peptide-methionine (S)-S-oxide reductase [Arsenicitalea aurantiaca]|uniref:Peptide methionine sulfoxide reductase MsrA n=2 Tax=Arsenicitalea aurantiaca TaxID=1783274 RepID=A0A433XGJ1_9HYPH|nr:peptide-methionine (S)-S-oxide reductase [Arsenicitalea aurantiaca]
MGLSAPVFAQAETAVAIFAGGCFWCVEKDFDDVEGVLDTLSGYIGGEAETANYQQVTYEDTGHYEAVQVTYDPAITDYDKLLTVFWHSVDPLDPDGQFCDRGPSYRTGIFPQTDQETEQAEASKLAVAAELNAEIATEIIPGKTFYPAEDYHQDYYLKNPVRYEYYRFACGRNARVDQVWGDRSYLGTSYRPE